MPKSCVKKMESPGMAKYTAYNSNLKIQVIGKLSSHKNCPIF